MENKRKNNSNGKKLNSVPPHSNDRAHTDVKSQSGGSAARELRPYGTRKINNSNQLRKDYSGASLNISANLTEADKRRQIERARKKEKVRRDRIRALVGLIVVFALTIILVFMTPLFNIREIHLNGNFTVPKETITAKVGDLVGSNLFGTSSSKIEKKMLEIPQIQSVEVHKNVFPSYIELFITERKPAAYLLCGNTKLVLDKNLQIIDDSGVFSTDTLPSISGISVTEYTVNSTLEIPSQEQYNILEVMLNAFDATALTNKITYISVDDLTAIKFNYDNRIEVLCGSQLQLERKIRMFTEALKTSTITENSMGTMDFSVPGQAVYDP